MAREVKFKNGHVYRSFFFNIGSSIDLEGLQKALPFDVVRRTMNAGRAQPQFLSFKKEPLVMKVAVSSLLFSGFACLEVEVAFYDVGVLVISLKIPVSGSFGRLTSFHKDLFESERARKWVSEWLEEHTPKIKPFVSSPNFETTPFKYSIFCMIDWTAPCEKSMVEETYPDELAKLLRATEEILSEEEVDDALSHRASFADDDFALIDYDAALFASGPQQEGRFLLEAMLVQFLKLRCIDQALNELIDVGIEYLRRPHSFLPVSTVSQEELTRIDPFAGTITEMMMRLDTMLDLAGGRYLERLHHIIIDRFKFEDMDEILTSKVDYLGEMYQHLHDERAIKSSEKLEWMIVVLIFVSLLSSFFYFPH